MMPAGVGMRPTSRNRTLGAAAATVFALGWMTSAWAELKPTWTVDLPGLADVAVGKTAVLAGVGSFVKAYDLRTGQLAYEAQVGGEVRALSTDGQSAVVVTREGPAVVLDPASGRARFRVPGE